MNNEHEDNQEIQLKFDFERMSCTNDNDSKEYMDDETLPFQMRRLIDQESQQILPHQEKIELINLGNNEEKKEVKIGMALSAEIKKEIIDLRQLGSRATDLEIDFRRFVHDTGVSSFMVVVSNRVATGRRWWRR